MRWMYSDMFDMRSRPRGYPARDHLLVLRYDQMQ